MHWVGLAINLHLSHVEVLDPFLTLYSDRKAKTALQPVLEMLPFFISKLTTNTPSQFDGDRPFTWQRREEIYINHKGGDCGPLSVKFMEMHANGDPEPHMADLTDEMVVEMRKQYSRHLPKHCNPNLHYPRVTNHRYLTTTLTLLLSKSLTTYVLFLYSFLFWVHATTTIYHGS